MTARTLRRAGWALFAVEVAAVLAWAVRVDRASPRRVVSAEVTGPARVKLGLPESRRRAIYAELVRHEPEDRAAVAREFTETQIWNRNHDNFFHQREKPRIASVGARYGLEPWAAYLVLDEGIREHWPPPPGVAVLSDDAPLARATRPVAERRVIAATPAGGPP